MIRVEVFRFRLHGGGHVVEGVANVMAPVVPGYTSTRTCCVVDPAPMTRTGTSATSVGGVMALWKREEATQQVRILGNSRRPCPCNGWVQRRLIFIRKVKHRRGAAKDSPVRLEILDASEMMRAI